MNRFVILGGAVLLLFALWTGAWFWAAGTAGAYVKTLETADGVTAPRVTCAQFSITGFPFGFDATCADATIVMADTTITVNGIKASALVYNPFHILAFAQSPVTIEDAFTGSRGRLDFADAEASARLTGWRIGRVSLVVNAPVWNDTVLEDRLVARASKAELHLVDVPELHDATKGLAALAEFVSIEGLNAPAQDIADGKATLEAQIVNLPDDVRTYGEADLLKRWQAAGGTFNIVGIKGTDGTDFTTTTGTLSLDAGGRVQGQLKIASKGVVERLEGLIPPEVKGLLLGGPAEDGSYSQTVNIAGGVVFSGFIPTAVIPPLF